MAVFSWRRIAICLALVAAALTLWFVAVQPATTTAATHLALILPDGFGQDDVHVHAWQDAAAELGFTLRLVSASQLLRHTDRYRDAALILPDTLHRKMNDALVANLHARTREGARILLVYDAGIEGMDGQYHPQQSRLSELAGVRYGLYGELGANMLPDQPALVTADALARLQLPPGKLVRSGSDEPLTSNQPAPHSGEQLTIVSYHYGQLHYPMFATEGTYNGQRLMQGDKNNLLAGVSRLGDGQVLFVNLPLTYLKLRTDSLFMHSFLRLFAQDIALLPQLSPMPDAQGALIMNWHIDSARAIPAMEKLEALGVFDQGPYSVHLTVGPDVDKVGDGGGMDLAKNQVMQTWVRRFAERGDELGSHGGWIHNAFGRLVGKQAPQLSAALIERNAALVSKISGHPVREYSAPDGNHPAWVTPWLRERGIKSYYFTGDIGMPPTRSYQEGLRSATDMWAYPVLSFGSVASFEEAYWKDIPGKQLTAWLNDVADFCSTNRTVRLVYFHPPGVAIFPDAFKQWLKHTGTLAREGRLRWTTMAKHTEFSNRRLLTQWEMHPETAQSDQFRLTASNPQSLDHISWLLPVHRYTKPHVIDGLAQVTRDGIYWRIDAGASLRLEMRTQMISARTSDNPYGIFEGAQLKFDPQCCQPGH